jgi:hypothetical protein
MKLTCCRYTVVCSVLAALLSFCWRSAAQNTGTFPQPRSIQGSGPDKAVMEMDASLPDHTLVIALGPIVQRNASSRAQPGPPTPGAPTLGPDTTQPPRNLPPAAAHLSQMIDAMNWAVAENERTVSKYHEHLDGRKIAAIHVPMAYIGGDAKDIAFNNPKADFDYLTKIPAFRAYERGVGHGGTYREANDGEFSGIAVAWLSWQLKADQRAARSFLGPNCGLCVNPKWAVRTKNLK